MEEQEHYPLYPRLSSGLRKHDRLMTQEAASIGKRLAEVEVLMGEAVFNIFNDYNDQYTMYLEVYQRVMNQQSPKYISINPYYFREMYKMEDQKGLTLGFIHDLHELFRMLLGQR